MDEFGQAQRETARWALLEALHSCSPRGAYDSTLRTYLASQGIPFTLLEVQRELDYLEARGLATLERGDHVQAWHADLTRAGVDLVEYVIPCEPGIARPPRR